MDAAPKGPVDVPDVGRQRFSATNSGPATHRNSSGSKKIDRQLFAETRPQGGLFSEWTTCSISSRADPQTAAASTCGSMRPSPRRNTNRSTVQAQRPAGTVVTTNAGATGEPQAANTVLNVGPGTGGRERRIGRALRMGQKNPVRSSYWSKGSRRAATFFGKDLALAVLDAGSGIARSYISGMEEHGGGWRCSSADRKRACRPAWRSRDGSRKPGGGWRRRAAGTAPRAFTSSANWSAANRTQPVPAPSTRSARPRPVHRRRRVGQSAADGLVPNRERSTAWPTFSPASWRRARTRLRDGGSAFVTTRGTAGRA